MFDMERTIWPVGHGGFYTETFEMSGSPFIVAYDCGARNMAIIEEQLRQATDDFKNPVDLLFISHFHRDHINGLSILKKKGCLRHIVLPQLTPARIIEAVLYNYLQTPASAASQAENQIVQNILINLLLRRTDARLTEVDDNGEQSQEPIFIDMERGFMRNKIAPGSNLVMLDKGKPIWRYIPVCYIDEKILEDLLNNLDRLMSGTLINEDKTINWDILENYLPNHRKEVKELYENHFPKGNDKQLHNNYSMPVYSGPIDDVIDCDLHHWRLFWKWLGDYDSDIAHYIDILVFHSAHCLYTGDFEANDEAKLNKMKEILGIYWPKVGFLQIPHHVSDSNYHPEFYDHRMLCFGNINNKGDESFTWSTFGDILLRHHCPPLIVTDEDDCLKFGYYFE